eukprot:6066829-Prymnesium_polylepis.1
MRGPRPHRGGADRHRPWPMLIAHRHRAWPLALGSVHWHHLAHEAMSRQGINHHCHTDTYTGSRARLTGRAAGQGSEEKCRFGAQSSCAPSQRC